MASVEEGRHALEEAGFTIKQVKEIQNATQLRTAEGPILCLWTNGNVTQQGKPEGALEDVVSSLKGRASAPRSGAKTKVFVVYGRDTTARDQLERMLRRWDLDPVILDQEASGGATTLIEKLEKYRKDVEYAVVLATPDDEGHLRGFPEQIKKRARQNVVLELGMMLGHLPRERIAVIQKDLPEDEWEPPSDIKGIVYLSYKEKVDDVRVDLYKELLAVGINIDPNKL